MAKGRKSVTFQLVSASNADDRAKSSYQRTLVRKISQNSIWKNRPVNEIPQELLESLDPHDFGIHDNLKESQREMLISSIYGTVDNFKSFAPPEAPSGVPSSITTEDLDGDCYFPKDGYDYEQHLATINPKFFIPVHRDGGMDGSLDTTGAKIDLGSSRDFPGLGDEAEDILEALEHDSDLEPLDDDFVTQAMQGESDVDDNAILWGNYKPMLPMMNGMMAGMVTEVPDGMGEGMGEDEGMSEEEEPPEHFGEYAEHSDEAMAQPGEHTNFAHSSTMAHSSLYRSVEQDFGGYKKESMDILNPSGPIGNICELVENQSDHETTSEYESEPSEEWDVETVLTTYTNATNHPRVISRSRPKAVPVIKTTNGPTIMARMMSTQGTPGVHNPPMDSPETGITTIQLPEVVTERRRGETKEEKRERKASVKRTKALILQMKRSNKESLKEAKKKNAIQNAKGSYDIVDGVKYLKL